MIKNVKPDADTLLFSEFAPEEDMREAMFDLLESHRVPTETTNRITSSIVRAMDDLKQLPSPSGKDGYLEVHIEVDGDRFRAKIDQVARGQQIDKPDDNSTFKTGQNRENGTLDLAALQDRMDEVKLDYRDGFHTTLELIRFLG